MSSVLTPQDQDFPRWYQEVISKAQLAENGPVRGTMVIRPWGYAIWERLEAAIDQRIKATGARNAYFPLLIPEAFLRREAEHVEGFSPELAVVTHGGGKTLEEPAVVRPTSETIVNSSFARWISSYRDLPLLINQWANVVRWELRPRLFLRTSEFLWQEGHTAHATRAEAHSYALRILEEVYADAMSEELATPVFRGRKTEGEKFAGAEISWSCEGMMRDRKALQMGTSHELGQNFARAFGIRFSDHEGRLRHVWQTSWGASTRLLGAMIMVHGDDRGLRVPPRLAPTQVVVLTARAGEGVLEAAQALIDDLRRLGVRVEPDNRLDISLGRRIVDHELRGVPLRIELGPRELADGRAVLARRVRNSKETFALRGLAEQVSRILDDDQRELFEQAIAMRDRRVRRAETLTDAIEIATDGFARIPWRACGPDAEDLMAAEGISVRCLLREDGQPVDDPDDAAVEALLARAY
ncbi:MAG TPA: proline--tRNA ligase [Solirubrobacteraceae bacterium]|nr:proline--tRNA ligase [Solirubrobacteraceae bacterium]